MPKLEYSELLDWFKSGAKPKKDWKIGTEHEKFVFYNDNLQRVRYLGTSGISELLNEVAGKYNWEKILENKNTIGLKDDTGASISLTPVITQSIGEIKPADLDTLQTLSSKNIAYKKWLNRRFKIYMDLLESSAPSHIMCQKKMYV